MSALAEVVKRTTPMAAAIEVTLHAPEIARRAAPGQFAQVLPEGVLLRRPFSFSRIDSARGEVSILFQVVGAGTAALARLHPGSTLDVLGPLGRGFVLDPAARRIAIIAGGLGIAAFPPLVALALDRRVEVEWCHGAATAAKLYPPPPGLRVHATAEDGTLGPPQRITDGLETVLARVDQAFVCGPTAMLLAVARQVAGWAGSRAQVALETPMACGLGTCLGCAVPSAQGGFRLACVDGPVVPFDAIDWRRMSEVTAPA